LSHFPNRQPLAADLRNKLIAKVFFDMGIIEHYGMGISKIKEECEKNSNPYPEWDNRLGAFTTVYRTRTAKPSQTNTKTIKIITPLQKKILLLLSQNPQVSKRQLAEKLPEETAGSIKYNIAQLQKFGLLKHSGPDHGGKWEVFVD
jgi:ATP-dependent DNA helicase RecG